MLFDIMFMSPRPQDQEKQYSLTIKNKASLLRSEERIPWHQDDLFGAKLFQDCAANRSSLNCNVSVSMPNLLSIGNGDDLNTPEDPCHASTAPANPLDSDTIRASSGGITNADVTKEAKATLMQAHGRRYLQRGKYRMLKLQKRLQDIKQETNKALGHIERRKQRKINKFQRKCTKKEDEREQEFQKVSGIIDYLKRDVSRLQRDNEKYRLGCADLKKDNRRLGASNNRTSWQSKRHEVDQLEDTNQQLRLTLQVHKEAVHHVREQCQQSSTPSSSSSKSRVQQAKKPSTSKRRSSSSPRHSSTRSSANKPYGSTIAINCVNEAEEHCFHYRLVQDVYTMTPKTMK